jgi:hypothetical protein
VPKYCQNTRSQMGGNQTPFMLAAYQERVSRARSLLPLKLLFMFSIGSLAVIRYLEGDMGRGNLKLTTPFQLGILLVCALLVLKSLYSISTRPVGVSLLDAAIVAI